MQCIVTYLKCKYILILRDFHSLPHHMLVNIFSMKNYIILEFMKKMNFPFTDF